MHGLKRIRDVRCSGIVYVLCVLPLYIHEGSRSRARPVRDGLKRNPNEAS